MYILNIMNTVNISNQAEFLTKRQTLILQMRAEGYLNKEIAYNLQISESTVKEHISNVLRKLNKKNVTQAVVYLVRQKII